MKPLSPLEVKASLRRARIMASLGERLLTSQLSKVPLNQAHLLCPELRHLAGKADRKKEVRAARLKLVPPPLLWIGRKSLMMLKRKSFVWSMKALSLNFWLRTHWKRKSRAFKNSSSNIRRKLHGGWRTLATWARSRRGISGRRSFVFCAGISGTNISSRRMASPESSSPGTCSKISRPCRQSGKLMPR